MKSKKSIKKRINILWIPGLGANEMMYAKIIEELNKTSYFFKHDFFKYYEVPLNTIKTLEEYADYSFEKNKDIIKKNYDFVVGTSLGGMLLQILFAKKKIKSKKYILLSTAFSKKDLTVLSQFSIFLLKWIKPKYRKIIQNLISNSYRIFRWNLKEKNVFSKMFKEFPTNVFFEAPLWIQNWEGIFPAFLENKKIITIHGKRDPLLSYKKIAKKKKPDLSISKGNHILFATCPKLIAKKIFELI
ncbi:MAG: hypothetical protein ACK4UJ_08180 [Leptonema sp. (in: bacteria)]